MILTRASFQNIYTPILRSKIMCTLWIDCALYIIYLVFFH